MLCENCGFELNDHELFCGNCGEAIKKIQDGEKNQMDRMPEVNENLQGDVEKVSPNVTKDNKGNYQWIYEFSFWKNPAILITTAKVMLIASIVPAMLMFFLTLADGIGEAFIILLTISGICIGICMVLLVIAYLLLGVLYGGKYYVLFKMDHRGINHIQLDKQYKKAQALGFLTAVIGLSAGNITAGGAGLMGAAKQSLYTRFSKVKSVKINRKRNTIYINESLKRNQIYADKEDFQFVRDYILKNCPKNICVSEK